MLWMQYTFLYLFDLLIFFFVTNSFCLKNLKTLNVIKEALWTREIFHQNPQSHSGVIEKKLWRRGKEKLDISGIFPHVI